jgi:hypothetical protein
MKRRLGAIVLPVVLGTVLALPAPPANAVSLGTCTAAKAVAISPGITAKLGRGTFHSSPGGAVVCAGVIHGKRVAGRAAIDFNGAYGVPIGDNCAQGKGHGTLTAKIGGISLKGGFTFVRVGALVVAVGTLSGGVVLVAPLGFAPALGQNCVTRPVTRATVAGQALLAGG